MKHFIPVLVSTSLLLYSCGSRVDLTTNYQENENYYNPALPSPHEVRNGTYLTSNTDQWSDQDLENFWEGGDVPVVSPNGALTRGNLFNTPLSLNSWGTSWGGTYPSYGSWENNYYSDDIGFTDHYGWDNGWNAGWGTFWNPYYTLWNSGSNYYGHQSYYHDPYGYNPYGYNPYGYYPYSPYGYYPYGYGNSSYGNTWTPTYPSGTTHKNTRRPSRYSAQSGNTSTNGRTSDGSGGTVGGNIQINRSSRIVTHIPNTTVQTRGTQSSSKPEKKEKKGFWNALLETTETNSTTSPRRTSTSRNSWESASPSKPANSNKNSSNWNSSNSNNNNSRPSYSPSRSSSTNNSSSSQRRR